MGSDSFESSNLAPRGLRHVQNYDRCVSALASMESDPIDSPRSGDRIALPSRTLVAKAGRSGGVSNPGGELLHGPYERLS